MENYPKINSKKTLFNGKFLKLHEVLLQTKNGKTKTHYNVERVETVSILPITTNYEIYLISQYRYIYGKRMIEAVAGTVDTGERPLETAKRELQEEAGIEAKKWDKIGTIYLAGSYIKSQVSLFLARELTLGKSSLEEDEDITRILLPLEEAAQKVLQGQITYAATISGILMLDRLKREGKI